MIILSLATANILQPDEVPAPTINDTFLVRFPIFLYNRSLGKVLNKQTPEHIAWEASLGEEQEEVDEAEASLRSAIPPNANGEARKRRSKAKS